MRSGWPRISDHVQNAYKLWIQLAFVKYFTHMFTLLTYFTHIRSHRNVSQKRYKTTSALHIVHYKKHHAANKSSAEKNCRTPALHDSLRDFHRCHRQQLHVQGYSSKSRPSYRKGAARSLGHHNNQAENNSRNKQQISIYHPNQVEPQMYMTLCQQQLIAV